jgi:hypothetical protein
MTTWESITTRFGDSAKNGARTGAREDDTWEAAKGLVDAAIKTHMETFDIDRETAAYWINGAMGGR